MRKALPTIQILATTAVCALLAAKLPSLADPDAASFSITGAVVGAAIALFAFLIGTRFSSLAPSLEAAGTPLELRLLRVALLALCVAVASFTALLYFPTAWVKAICGFAVITGATCVFTLLIVKWSPAGGGRDV